MSKEELVQMLRDHSLGDVLAALHEVVGPQDSPIKDEDKESARMLMSGYGNLKPHNSIALIAKIQMLKDAGFVQM